MEFIDYYKTLGVNRTATPTEIKKAYRRLAKRWHPDAHESGTKEEAEKQFKLIAEAYEVLSDTEKREKYDQLGADWKTVDTGSGQHSGGAPTQYRTMSPEEFEQVFGGSGFSDFFATFFGPDMASKFGEKRSRHPRYCWKGADIRARIAIPLRQAIAGCQREFDIDGEAACTVCGGTGLLEGKHICPTCAGLGRRRERRSVSLRIPADVRPGQTLRLKGLGESGANGASPGDLLVTVDVEDDGPYTLRGSDVFADVPVAPWEAALGATVDVQTARRSVSMKIPPNSASGAKLRIRGDGLKRADGTFGDFIARIGITLPSALSSEMQQLYRKMADQSPNPPTGGARASAREPKQ